MYESYYIIYFYYLPYLITLICVKTLHVYINFKILIILYYIVIKLYQNFVTLIYEKIYIYMFTHTHSISAGRHASCYKSKPLC